MYSLLTRILSSVTFALLICCGEKTIPSANKKKKFVSRIFIRAQIILKESGLVKINLQAPLIEEYTSSEKNNAYTLFPKGVKLHYYEKEKAQLGFLQADWGKAMEEEKLYEVQGNVMITNSCKDTLKTSHIFWNRKERRIYNDVPTEIHRADGTVINAKNGLEGSDELKEITLKNTDGLIHLYQDPAR
ncbi:MAG: LPS export ABC transporter periplasmic protein LptC [Flavobacteriales bacterium Tduv]